MQRTNKITLIIFLAAVAYFGVLLTGCINLDKVRTLEIDTPFADFELIGKEGSE
jgi:outer membrane murein-binding lipoprotein Lpp